MDLFTVCRRRRRCRRRRPKKRRGRESTASTYRCCREQNRFGPLLILYLIQRNESIQVVSRMAQFQLVNILLGSSDWKKKKKKKKKKKSFYNLIIKKEMRPCTLRPAQWAQI